MRVVAALLWLLMSGVAGAQAPLPRFDGDRALAYTREFVATGLRWVGSKGHAKAQAFLESALKLADNEPLKIRTHRALARLHEQLGDSEKASLHYRESALAMNVV